MFHDLRYAFRTVRHAPVVAGVSIVTLAVAIGASTAVFSVVNAVLLRPLPYADSDRLVKLWERRALGGDRHFSVSAAEFEAWRDQNEVLSGVAALDYRQFNLTGGGEPLHLAGAPVSVGFFDVLGVRAALGRTFRPEESRPGQNQVVVISHALWERRFAASPDAVGRTIALDGTPYRVIGVLPAGFFFFNFNDVDLWVPIRLASDPAEARSDHYLEVVGRLAPGVTLSQARAQFAAISDRLHQDGTALATHSAALGTLHDAVVGDVRTPLLLMLGAVVFVLLIACANVANLLLARGVGRARETAVRVALGAGRAQLVRQFLTESLLLSLAGGAGGLLLTLWGTDVLASASQEIATRTSGVPVDARVLGFALLASLATGAIFGLAPALHASKPDVGGTLKEASRATSASPRQQRVHGALIVAEVALALVLLAGAGLLLRTFVNLERVPPGFDPADVVVADVSLPAERYAGGAEQAAFFGALVERLGALPGVERAAAVSPLPLSGNTESGGFVVEGRPDSSAADRAHANLSAITPDYFAAMRIPLLAGRAVTAGDAAGAEPVAVVSEALARQYWPDGGALGRRIRIGTGPWTTIIGVAGDVHHRSLGQAPGLEIYRPCAQAPASEMTVVARAAGGAAVAAPIRAAVRELDPNLPVGEVGTLEALLAGSLASPRLELVLLASFAAVALALAAIGLYGVMSYLVGRRTHEIGVRMAFGARAGDILRLVVGRAARLVAAGILAGAVGALALTRLMAGLLFGVSPSDPLTLGLVAGLLFAVGLVASYLPARRATRVDPMVALRMD